MAGALCSRVEQRQPGSALPLLEAMGQGPINRAVNAVALCNRFLEGRDCGRLAFVPVVRLFVQHPDAPGAAGEDAADADGGELGRDASPRRAMRFHLRLLPPPRAAGAEPRAGDDVIRVATVTDVVRLSGLISSRWANAEAGIDVSGIYLQAMGARCIDTMVRALAMSWQKKARSYEGAYEEAGFACLPTHMALPASGGAAGGAAGGGAAQASSSSASSVLPGAPLSPGRFSGVQCWVMPPDFTE